MADGQESSGLRFTWSQRANDAKLSGFFFSGETPQGNRDEDIEACRAFGCRAGRLHGRPGLRPSGAAQALYYPTISLTGALGSASTAFGDFLSGPATLWALAAGLAGPIYTFGGIEGHAQSAKAGEQQALFFYQQTILNAFRETNNALPGSRNKLEESTLQANRVVSLRESARLSRLRSDNGLASYVEVLVADNELFAAELASDSTIADRYMQLVGVYQAMGGGWVDLAESLAPRPQGMAAAAAP